MPHRELHEHIRQLQVEIDRLREEREHYEAKHAQIACAAVKLRRLQLRCHVLLEDIDTALTGINSLGEEVS